MIPVPEWVKLGMWSVTETNGFIFVWFHTKRELPSWNIDPIPEITERKWSYRGRSEMRVACHIQVSKYFLLSFIYSLHLSWYKGNSGEWGRHCSSECAPL